MLKILVPGCYRGDEKRCKRALIHPQRRCLHTFNGDVFGKGRTYLGVKTKICRKVTDMGVSEVKVLKQCTQITLHEIPIENLTIGRLTLPELLNKLMTKDR